MTMGVLSISAGRTRRRSQTTNSGPLALDPVFSGVRKWGVRHTFLQSILLDNTENVTSSLCSINGIT